MSELLHYDQEPRDMVTDDGDVLPFYETPDEEVQPYWLVKKEYITTHPGVAVDLAERAMALMRLAAMYGKYNRSIGLQEAVTIPEHRKELETRYSDVDRVAEGALKNASYRPLVDEQAVLEPLLKKDELKKAGYLEADVEEAALITTIRARQAFGPGVHSRERSKNLKKILRQ